MARKDPSVAFRFGVAFDAISLGGFSEVSGIDVSVEYVEIPEGGLFSKIWAFPKRLGSSDVTLKRGIVNCRVFQWFVSGLITGVVGMNFTRTMSIWIKDPSGKIESSFTFFNVRPLKWNGPNLDASSNNLAIEELTIRHSGVLWLPR